MRKFAPILSVLILVGCGDSPGDTASGAYPSSTSGHMPFELTQEQQEGWVIYETLCWSCHGTSGRGNGPAVEYGSSAVPPSFHTLDYARASTESLLRQFRSGVGGSEPAHPHMRYVASILQPEHFANALSFLPVLAYPPEIPGSALAGKAIFDARCAGCHGTDGTGDGPDAARFTTLQPADFTADSLIAARDWDALFVKVAQGSGSVHSEAMPAWSDVLSEDDIWDVVSFVATFQSGVLRAPYWMD